VAFPRELAALLVCSVALAILGTVAQASIELAATAFILPDVLVNGLVADVQPAVEPQHSTDLLGTQIGAQQVSNQVPVGGGELTLAPRPRATPVGLLLGTSEAIRSIEPRAIP